MMIMKEGLGYAKLDREDPEEVAHRRAQFLICKVMEQAAPTSSFMRIRMWKLKIKIGRRLKKMRRSMLLGLSAVRVSAYKKIVGCFKTCKALFGRHSHGGSTLPMPTLIT